MPNECEKECDKDASNGTTDETGQTHTSFRPSKEERKFKVVSHLSQIYFFSSRISVLRTLPRSLGFSGQLTTLRQTVESFLFNHLAHFVFTRYNSCARATLNTWKTTLDFILVH